MRTQLLLSLRRRCRGRAPEPAAAQIAQRPVQQASHLQEGELPGPSVARFRPAACLGRRVPDAAGEPAQQGGQPSGARGRVLRSDRPRARRRTRRPASSGRPRYGDGDARRSRPAGRRGCGRPIRTRKKASRSSPPCAGVPVPVAGSKPPRARSMSVRKAILVAGAEASGSEREQRVVRRVVQRPGARGVPLGESAVPLQRGLGSGLSSAGTIRPVTQPIRAVAGEGCGEFGQPAGVDERVVVREGGDPAARQGQSPVVCAGQTGHGLADVADPSAVGLAGPGARRHRPSGRCPPRSPRTAGTPSAGASPGTVAAAGAGRGWRR